MKRVLVTGGLSNLGKAIRKKFESNGFEVWYTVSREGKTDSERALVIDLCDEKKTKEVLKDLGPFDVLVNNAGIFTEGSQETLELQSFDRVFDINMRGLFTVTQSLLPGLREKDGSVVNISSMNALHPGFGTTAHYDASKGAVSSYTASLASETGLRVNAVAPGLIRREALDGSDLESYWKSHSVKQCMMDAEEIADLVFFLSQSRGIYGQTVLIDNGFCLR